MLRVLTNMFTIDISFRSSNKKVNPYKACIYGLCRDFLDGVGYDLGTKYLFTFKYSSFIT